MSQFDHEEYGERLNDLSTDMMEDGASAAQVVAVFDAQADLVARAAGIEDEIRTARRDMREEGHRL